MIESALRAQLRGQNKLDAEFDISHYRGDLLITFGGFRLLVEFKRVRLNALLPPPSLKIIWPTDLPGEKVKWRPDELHELSSFLEKQQIENLLDCIIHPVRRYQYDDYASVREIVKSAQLQVQNYAIELMKENPTLPCYAFIVVQIGYPLFIQKVDV